MEKPNIKDFQYENGEMKDLIGYVESIEEYNQYLENKIKNQIESLKNNHPKPKLEDFYDTSDPRGCSSSEYEDYQKALEQWTTYNSFIKTVINNLNDIA